MAYVTTRTSDDPVVIAARIMRLTRFAGDVLDLADHRADRDLRALIDDLHRDLIELLKEDRWRSDRKSVV